MADLKYFIRESQRFRAGAGYVEAGMRELGERFTVHLSTLVEQWAKCCSL